MKKFIFVYEQQIGFFERTKVKITSKQTLNCIINATDKEKAYSIYEDFVDSKEDELHKNIKNDYTYGFVNIVLLNLIEI